MGGASQPGAERRGWAASVGTGTARTAREERFALVLPPAVLGAVAAVTFLWRSLAWEPAVRVDGWAYAAWGQALARGERPLFELGATTPKPLAALIGLIVVPLPPERALALVAAVALAVIAASLFAAAFREAGAVAAAVAVAAFAFGVELNVVVAFGYIDAVVAALIMVGMALRGRLRVGALVVAGLLRPDAWLLAAIAGYLGTMGSWRRRVGTAVLAGAAAPALWVLADLILMRDPLGTAHWQTQRRQELDVENIPWTDVPGDFWDALIEQGSVVLVAAGLLGLVLHYIRNRRLRRGDAFPLVVVVCWSLLLALQTHFGGVNPRYLLPVVSTLALGCGFLVARVLPRPLNARAPWPAIAFSAGAVVAATLVMDMGHGVQVLIERNAAIERSRPLLESALSCGRLRVIPRIPARDAIPQLAASARRSLDEFGISRERGPYTAVLFRTRRERPMDGRLPPWPHHDTPLGPLAIAPGCEPFQ